MPIYEYVCESCGECQQHLLRRASAPTPSCKACHKNTLVRQVSATAFHLKGGGWYKQGYESGGDTSNKEA